jgi:hypothetical protein
MVFGVLLSMFLCFHAIHGVPHGLDRLGSGGLLGQRQAGSVFGDDLRIGGWRLTATGEQQDGGGDGE